MLELCIPQFNQNREFLFRKYSKPNMSATVNKTVNSNVPRPEQCEEDAFVFLTSWCQVKVQSTSAYIYSILPKWMILHVDKRSFRQWSFHGLECHASLSQRYKT